MDSSDFVIFGVPHCVAIAATAVAAVFMVRLNRSPLVSPERKQRANVILAVILLISVSLDPLLTWLRYRESPDTVWRPVIETALPFYLCDVVSFVLAFALVRRRQRWAELGYLWGMAGTLQGLLTPTLKYSWDAPEYYAFFVQHGGVPVAAVTLAFGTALKPHPGAFGRVVFWSWMYLAVVYGLNRLLGANYGFLNAKPPVPSLLDYMGPYPWYFLTLQFVAFALYLLLLMPFRRRNIARGD